MKTTLRGEGVIDIPKEIREEDKLVPGDSFELRRIIPGQYILSKTPHSLRAVNVRIAEDGLPTIQGGSLITNKMIRELESQTA
jgi:bifunctional DNA-binding transcriptional regulator/antitoxin component of YhaV-PrlF toxin-antitoxin module